MDLSTKTLRQLKSSDENSQVFDLLQQQERTVQTFQRGLKPIALATLNAMAGESGTNWWKDLLTLWTPSGRANSAQPLRIAVRKNYLNFYLRGQSVARVGFDRYNVPYINVHLKYAFSDATEQAYAKLIGTDVLHSRSGRSAPYSGIATLRDWIARAAAWETAEKALVEKVVAGNPGIIDLEMGLPAHAGQNSALRMDLVALEAKDDRARIVFWEAKRITDARLRSRSDRPEVITQIESYRSYLSNSEHRDAVIASYRETCCILLSFARTTKRCGEEKLAPIVINVAEGHVDLVVDETPRLVIFGAAEQLGSQVWLDHQAKLEKLGIHLTTLCSDAADFSLPIVSV